MFLPSSPRLPPGWEGDRKMESVEDGLKIKGQPEQTGFESGCPPPAAGVVAVEGQEGNGVPPCHPCRGRTEPSGLSPPPLKELDVAVDLLFYFICFDF